MKQRKKKTTQRFFGTKVMAKVVTKQNVTFSPLPYIEEVNTFFLFTKAEVGFPFLSQLIFSNVAIFVYEICSLISHHTVFSMYEHADLIVHLVQVSCAELCKHCWHAQVECAVAALRDRMYAHRATQRRRQFKKTKETACNEIGKSYLCQN